MHLDWTHLNEMKKKERELINFTFPYHDFKKRQEEIHISTKHFSGRRVKVKVTTILVRSISIGNVMQILW